ncbi:MAG: metalloregulator ArsR/SmtB family transcription factor [Clostridia bacterium]|nr:metalloregulator ArsR/SmtB family transcription factor [Clostridia bacterium]
MKETKEVIELHEERVRKAKENMLPEGDVETLAARFKAISEPSRLAILLALRYGELCVEHITEAVGGNQSAVSHQLKTLKDGRIIKSRRDGKNVYYSVSDEHVVKMIDLALEHLGCAE